MYDTTTKGLTLPLYYAMALEVILPKAQLKYLFLWNTVDEIWPLGTLSSIMMVLLDSGLPIKIIWICKY